MSIIDFKSFPKTRYQGSKRKILPWIHEALKDVEFETVLDGFGGTGIVSYLFKKMNKSVTFNDSLKFNYYSAKAFIENSKVKLLDKDKRNLLDNISQSNPKIIQRHFKDVYFLEHENEWLDNTAYGILNMNHYTGSVLEYKKAIAYHSLFQSSLIKRPYNLFHRKNLNLRLADVTRTFGNKSSWDKSFDIHFDQFINETNRVIFDSGRKCVSINQPIMQLKKVDYDLVYLDPPYISSNGSNETSDYLRCYHFLEGLCNYDQWENLIDFDTINKRFHNNHSPKDFMSKDIETTYRDLFQKFHKSKIVLSYKQGGIPSIETLVRIMKEYKKTVYSHSLNYKYALSKQNGNATINREVLIIGM